VPLMMAAHGWKIQLVPTGLIVVVAMRAAPCTAVQQIVTTQSRRSGAA